MLRREVLVLALAGLVGCGSSDPPRGDPRLDALFAELAASPDAHAAERLEAQIWAAWTTPESPTVTVLLSRAQMAEGHGRPGLARRYLDEASRLDPGLAEPYNRRAVLAFAERDYPEAIENIEAVLAREPRHFGALMGLGAVYERLGEEAAALEAYRAALKLHPFLEPARQGVARLAPMVEGAEA